MCLARLSAATTLSPLEPLIQTDPNCLHTADQPNTPTPEQPIPLQSRLNKYYQKSYEIIGHSNIVFKRLINSFVFLPIYILHLACEWCI